MLENRATRSSCSSASRLPSSLLLLFSPLEWNWLHGEDFVVYITLVVLNKFLVYQFKIVFHHILYQSVRVELKLVLMLRSCEHLQLLHERTLVFSQTLRVFPLLF